MSKYRSEDEILAVVRSFEDATIGRDEWKHAEHLLVALYYVDSFGLEEGTRKMREGILNLLSKGFNVDLEKEMPYHETITVFWMRTVYGFSIINSEMPLAKKAGLMIETFDKDLPLRFYSKERLFSDEARARFVEPAELDSYSACDHIYSHLSTPT